MSDLIREALENLVRQQDGHPRSLEKLRRQGLSQDHPTVTATMEGHRLMMEKAWQQAREAIARTPYPTTRQQEAGSEPSDEQIESVLRRSVADGEDVAFYLLHGCAGVSVEVETIMVREVARTMLAAAPSTPENAGGVATGYDGVTTHPEFGSNAGVPAAASVDELMRLIEEWGSDVNYGVGNMAIPSAIREYAERLATTVPLPDPQPKAPSGTGGGEHG